MKILDRYVLATFLKNYLISFLVLVGLYVVLDMVFNFDELVEGKSQFVGGGVRSTLGLVRDIASFYFYQIFLFFVHLSGIIPVVAAAFTLIRLGRFNELTAILAAGVPLLRVTMPIILASLVLNALLLVDQELIIPRIIPQLLREHDELRQTGTSAFPIKGMQDNQNGLLYAAEYYPPAGGEGAWMRELDVITYDENFQPLAHLRARQARWDGRQWQLTEGQLVRGLLPHQRRSVETVVETYGGNITPEEIAMYRSGHAVELLSTERINQMLHRPQSYGATDLLRVKHARFTQPLMNIILLLLAISCLLSREPGGIKTAAVLCIGLIGLCLAGVFLTQHLAGSPPAGRPEWSDSWPAVMAWMPILLFGPLAVWLLDRVKT